MEGQNQRNILSEEAQLSDMLEQKAKNEMLETGQVTVICPKCQHHPKVIIQGKYLERIFVRCKCGFSQCLNMVFNNKRRRKFTVNY